MNRPRWLASVCGEGLMTPASPPSVLCAFVLHIKPQSIHPSNARRASRRLRQPRPARPDACITPSALLRLQHPLSCARASVVLPPMQAIVTLPTSSAWMDGLRLYVEYKGAQDRRRRRRRHETFTAHTGEPAQAICQGPGRSTTRTRRRSGGSQRLACVAVPRTHMLVTDGASQRRRRGVESCKGARPSFEWARDTIARWGEQFHPSENTQGMTRMVWTGAPADEPGVPQSQPEPEGWKASLQRRADPGAARAASPGRVRDRARSTSAGCHEVGRPC